MTKPPIRLSVIDPFPPRTFTSVFQFNSTPTGFSVVKFGLTHFTLDPPKGQERSPPQSISHDESRPPPHTSYSGPFIFFDVKSSSTFGAPYLGSSGVPLPNVLFLPPSGLHEEQPSCTLFFLTTLPSSGPNGFLLFNTF